MYDLKVEGRLMYLGCFEARYIYEILTHRLQLPADSILIESVIK